MRPDTRNKRSYGRSYSMEAAREDLANGVHFSVVAVRLGVSEEDLAFSLDTYSDALASLQAEEAGRRR